MRHRFYNAIYYRFFKIYKKVYLSLFSLKKPQRLAPVNEAPKIVVSFTTIPSRLPELPMMLKSIFCQTHLPDRLLLYVSAQQFEGIDLEKYLKDQIDLGLEIRYVDEDLRSHKKYFYAKQEFPDSCIILVDDDIVYTANTLKKLWVSYKKNPDAISALRCHGITFLKNGEISPYREWAYEVTGCTTPNSQLFFTSGGGTLLPPNFRTEHLFDRASIREYSFLADDVWLNGLARYTGVPIIKASARRGTPLVISEDQTESLSSVNVIDGNNNDICLRNMTEAYKIQWNGE